MFLTWYRNKIAKRVEEKMGYLCTCPNERDIILHIISPKTYSGCIKNHCTTDCNHYDCKTYKRIHESTRDNPAKDVHPTSLI